MRLLVDLATDDNRALRLALQAIQTVIDGRAEKAEESRAAAPPVATKKPGPTKRAKAPEPEEKTAEDKSDTPEGLDQEVMDWCVKTATDLMSSGHADKVRAALKSAGAKKVTAIEDDAQLGKFADALRAAVEED